MNGIQAEVDGFPAEVDGSLAGAAGLWRRQMISGECGWRFGDCSWVPANGGVLLANDGDGFAGGGVGLALGDTLPARVIDVSTWVSDIIQLSG